LCHTCINDTNNNNNIIIIIIIGWTESGKAVLNETLIIYKYDAAWSD